MWRGTRTERSMTVTLRLLTGSVLCGLAALAQAADVRVQGLFPDRALLSIDGKSRMLKVGDSSPEGVKLLKVDSSAAVLEIDGKRETLGLSADIHTSLSTPQVVRVQIARDNSGMYTTTGAINGTPVGFMVDTGATSVAMNAATAERLGIPFRHEGKPVTVQTAAGAVRSWEVLLKSVKVGEIERKQVQAVVIEARSNNDILLGMSFLSTVKLEKQNNLLVLEARY